MIKLFDKIFDKEKNKLINYLEGLYYTFKKNDNISKILKDHIIGIIIKGNAKIIHTDYNGNKLIIEELYEDDIFGSNLSYLYNKEYDMIANEETTVLVFDYDLVINTNLNQEYFNTFLKNIMIILNDKIRKRNDRLQIISKKTIRDKLLEYFDIESQAHGSSIIYLTISFSELADFLAIDRSAMHRELKNLKEEGIIDIKDKKIILLYRHSFAI